MIPAGRGGHCEDKAVVSAASKNQFVDRYMIKAARVGQWEYRAVIPAGRGGHCEDKAVIPAASKNQF